jgi:hypothetical protein
MVIRQRQEIRFSVREPTLGRGTLTLRAVPVATRVVGDLLRVALTTAQHMAAERGRATTLNSRHGLELTETEVPGIFMPPCPPVVAEDIRDL